MKLFGEFLIEKNAITNTQLITALVSQIKTLPSFAEAAFETKVFGDEKLLAIVSAQTKLKLGFVDAAKNLGVWTPENQKKIEDYITSKRIPVGQLLIEQGAISSDNLSKMLDEFLGELKESDIRKSESQAPVQTTSQIEATQGEINPAFLTYVESFSESLHDETENVMNFLGDPSQDAMLQSVLESVHYLRGAARLVQAANSERVLTSLENFLRKGQKDPSFQTKGDFQESARKAWELAWSIRQNIANTGQETQGPQDVVASTIEATLKSLEV